MTGTAETAPEVVAHGSSSREPHPATSDQSAGRKGWLARMIEWLLLRQAIAEASRHERPEDELALIRQARELVEVAHRLALRNEPPQVGSGLGTALVLYREAFALCREIPASPGHLLPLGSETHRAGASALLDRSTAAVAGLSDREKAAEIAIAHPLLGAALLDLDLPRRARQRLFVRRAVRCLALLTALAGVAVLVVKRNEPPSLLKGRPYKTSSVYSGFSPETGKSNGSPTKIFFHTDEESRPSIEFDLGKVEKVHRVRVKNRSDCCGERAVPLRVEVSIDRSSWTKVFAQKEQFDVIDRSFSPVDARYLRLVVAKTTSLHLEEVAAW